MQLWTLLCLCLSAGILSFFLEGCGKGTDKEAKKGNNEASADSEEFITASEEFFEKFFYLSILKDEARDKIMDEASKHAETPSLLEQPLRKEILKFIEEHFDPENSSWITDMLSREKCIDLLKAYGVLDHPLSQLDHGSEEEHVLLMGIALRGVTDMMSREEVPPMEQQLGLVARFSRNVERRVYETA